MVGLSDEEIFEGLDSGDEIAARAAQRRIEELQQSLHDLRARTAQERRIRDAAVELCAAVPRMSPLWRLMIPLAAAINGHEPSRYELGGGPGDTSPPRAQHDSIAGSLEFYPHEFARMLRENPDLFGRMLQDLLKIGTDGPRRPGPRARPEEATHGAELEQLLGQSYTTKTFDVALRELAPDATVRQLSNRLGIGRDVMHRLRNGAHPPDLWHMQAAADAFGLRPDYFLEFRMIGLVAVMVERLTANSELSVNLWRVATRAPAA